MGVNIVQAVKEYLFRAAFAFVKELDIFLSPIEMQPTNWFTVVVIK